MENNKPENNKSDLILDMTNNTAIWSINLIGDIQGTYQGQFVFKCFLSPLEQLAAGRVYKDLLGPNLSDSNANERYLAFCLSQLKYRIVKAPPFWKGNEALDGGQIPDTDVLTQVLESAINAEIRFKEEMSKKREGTLNDAIKAAENAKAALIDDFKKGT